MRHSPSLFNRISKWPHTASDSGFSWKQLLGCDTSNQWKCCLNGDNQHWRLNRECENVTELKTLILHLKFIRIFYYLWNYTHYFPTKFRLLNDFFIKTKYDACNIVALRCLPILFSILYLIPRLPNSSQTVSGGSTLLVYHVNILGSVIGSTKLKSLLCDQVCIHNSRSASTFNEVI